MFQTTNQWCYEMSFMSFLCCKNAIDLISGFVRKNWISEHVAIQITHLSFRNRRWILSRSLMSVSIKCSGFQNVETHWFDKIPELQRQSPLPAMLTGGDIFMDCHSTNGVTYWLHPGWWFQPTPPKNDGVRQLGWWHSQYMESHKSHVPNHQPGHIPTWLLVEPTSIWLHHC